ncbi:MAG: sigma-70 family RNA polymerase sigma factor [Labilithrix sp.]|nr:sigma-70 family RNA polymerase sigma factor [Labilithrix sp.]
MKADEIRALWDAGDMSRCASAAIEAHGPEVLGWLVVTTGDASEAEEAFATASEDLWRGLSTFRWECSIRAWLYALSRHALIRRRKVAAERRERRLPLDEASSVVDRVRTRTRPWLRTEVKDVFAELRASLAESERELLVLRVDRDLSWDEIATVLDEPAPRLRKRFQAIKEKLRAGARDKGLMGEEP